MGDLVRVPMSVIMNQFFVGVKGFERSGETDE